MSISVDKLSDLIVEYCATPEAKQLFSKWVGKSGPDEGACYAIAEALRQVSGSGQLVGLGYEYQEGYRDNGHILLEAGSVYIDGFGLHSEQEVLNGSTARKIIDAAKEEYGYKNVDISIEPIDPNWTAEFFTTDNEFVVDILEGLNRLIKTDK